MRFSTRLLAASACCYASATFSITNSSFDLQSAINRAEPHAVVEIPPGIYTGSFTLDKPLTLSGQKGVILDGKGRGSVLIVNSPDVVIKGMTIRNTGSSIGGENSGIHANDSPRFHAEGVTIRDALFGIRVMASPGSLIRSCDISGKDLDVGRRGDGIKVWYSPGTKIINSNIRDVRDILIWYSDNSRIEGNKISGGRYGIHYMYSHDNATVGNDISSNSVGIYNMYSHDLAVLDNRISNNRGASGYGFAAKESNRVKVLRNEIINNRIGIHIDNSPIEEPKTKDERTLIEDNLVAYNDIGVNFVGPGNWVSLLSNDFYNNWQQVHGAGTKRLMADWHKNFWSDYLGFDRENDGYGSVAYRSVSIVDKLLDRNEVLQVFRFSPAITAIEFAERALPWLQPEPKFIDPQPAMKMKSKITGANESGVAPFTLLIGLGLALLAGLTTRLLSI